MREGAAGAGMGLGRGGREEGEGGTGGKRLGGLVGWLGREVEGAQEAVHSRKRGATVTSELFLGGTSWGRSPFGFTWLPSSVSVSKCLLLGAPSHGCSFWPQA